MSLLEIINEMREDVDKLPLDQLVSTMHLRDDLEFDSLQLAELTVQIEDAFDIDIFADGIVQTIGEIQQKLIGV